MTPDHLPTTAAPPAPVVRSRTADGLPVVAFGPVMPGWGSWDWVGASLRDSIAATHATTSFAAWDEVEADVVVVVKHAPPADWVAAHRGRGAVVLFCPIDYYGHAAEIDADGAVLGQFDRIVVHSERLRRYFQPYASVDYLDHSIRYAAPLRARFRPDGPILWVGVRSNLPPFIDWVNRHGVPGPLQVLTNLPDPAHPPTAVDLGFAARLDAQVVDWCPHLHAEMTAAARAVIDIKGGDFRGRHKPPAKGIDVLASGVPLAMNPDSSTVEHLAHLGFAVADPLDVDHWLSVEYWEDTRAFGAALRELLDVDRIALRFARIVEEARSTRSTGRALGRATPAPALALGSNPPAVV